ncbi:MAG: sulfite exporter TauE/SafE family protein [Anaerolineae bacterium]|nr:MAG: sulfite exporter TauE/SafE family protein [Anaerolineae bacterium]
MDASSVTLPLAAFAGLLSFLSPCVLPLVPAYLGYLSGATVGRAGEEQPRRYEAFLHALFFVLGFTAIFVALGATASLIGQLLNQHIFTLQRIGGIIVIIFGLHTIGVVKIPFLYREARAEIESRPQLGYLSSFLIGLVFAAGWTPCVGVVLSAIFLLAADSQTLGQGMLMLAAYSLGLGLPFLMVGGAFETIAPWLRKLNRHLNVVSMVSGVFLIAVGVAIFAGWLTYLARFGTFLNVEI